MGSVIGAAQVDVGFVLDQLCRGPAAEAPVPTEPWHRCHLPRPRRETGGPELARVGAPTYERILVPP